MSEFRISKSKKMAALVLSFGLIFSLAGHAQSDDFESELNDAEGSFTEPSPYDEGADAGTSASEEDSSAVSEFDDPVPEEPQAIPESGPASSFGQAPIESDGLTSPERQTFRKPKGPPGGGTLEVPHPNAAKGLLRIQKDGNYIYKTPVVEKSRSASLRVGYLTSPSIQSVSGVNFSQIYGDGGLFGLVGEYEWQPFRQFGMLGLQLGAGVVVARGNGRFASGETAQEIYNLGVVPLSANLVYRFEYVRRQWIVPFVTGGGIGYGLVEMRNDGKAPTFALAPAVSAGGGVHFSVSAWDTAGSFILGQEYGVADLWLTVEAKVIQGLNPDLDFTNQTLSAGFTVDF